MVNGDTVTLVVLTVAAIDCYHILIICEIGFLPFKCLLFQEGEVNSCEVHASTLHTTSFHIPIYFIFKSLLSGYISQME